MFFFKKMFVFFVAGFKQLPTPHYPPFLLLVINNRKRKEAQQKRCDTEGDITNNLFPIQDPQDFLFQTIIIILLFCG